MLQTVRLAHSRKQALLDASRVQSRAGQHTADAVLPVGGPAPAMLPALHVHRGRLPASTQPGPLPGRRQHLFLCRCASGSFQPTAQQADTLACWQS